MVTGAISLARELWYIVASYLNEAIIKHLHQFLPIFTEEFWSHRAKQGKIADAAHIIARRYSYKRLFFPLWHEYNADNEEEEIQALPIIIACTCDIFYDRWGQMYLCNKKRKTINFIPIPGRSVCQWWNLENNETTLFYLDHEHNLCYLTCERGVTSTWLVRANVLQMLCVQNRVLLLDTNHRVWLDTYVPDVDCGVNILAEVVELVYTNKCIQIAMARSVSVSRNFMEWFLFEDGTCLCQAAGQEYHYSNIDHLLSLDRYRVMFHQGNVWMVATLRSGQLTIRESDMVPDFLIDNRPFFFYEQGVISYLDWQNKETHDNHHYISF